MFLEQEISTLEWFLKDHVTEDWSNDSGDLFVPSHYIYIVPFIIYSNGKHNITAFAVFLLK